MHHPTLLLGGPICFMESILVTKSGSGWDWVNYGSVQNFKLQLLSFDFGSGPLKPRHEQS